MKLTRIALENYRHFDKFEISFDPKLTVIVARNGQGKTTVLEAIAAALGPFVGAFDEGRAEHIRRTDARYSQVGNGPENEQNFPVYIDATMVEPAISWQRALRSARGRTTTREAAPLAQWGHELQNELRNTFETRLPVIRYYSSKRLWVSHNDTQTRATLTESRTAGYEDCLSSLSSFVQLQRWMKQATLADIQQHTQAGYERANLRSRLQGIADAVGTVMESEDWRGFHYSLVFEELAMVHPQHGALPISLLSDGMRAMITLAADLALRCVRLNAYLMERAPLESTGIVLIDEVDLHLHPAWQQKVMQSLRRAFPGLQFIVSSHSPQVLSTVRQENVRVVFKDADDRWQAQPPSQEISGLESAFALNEVMGVNPIPDVQDAQLVADYTAAIEDGEHDSDHGQKLRSRLLDIYGPDHPVLIDADRLIRFQQFKLRHHQGQRGA